MLQRFLIHEKHSPHPACHNFLGQANYVVDSYRNEMLSARNLKMATN